MEAGLPKHRAANLWRENDLRYLDAKVLVPRRGRG